MLPVAHASGQSVATGAAREALAAVATTAPWTFRSALVDLISG